MFGTHAGPDTQNTPHNRISGCLSGADEAEMIARMQTLWARFVRDGEPGGGWRVFSGAAKAGDIGVERLAEERCVMRPVVADVGAPMHAVRCMRCAAWCRRGPGGAGYVCFMNARVLHAVRCDMRHAPSVARCMLHVVCCKLYVAGRRPRCTSTVLAMASIFCTITVRRGAPSGGRAPIRHWSHGGDGSTVTAALTRPASNRTAEQSQLLRRLEMENAGL